MDDDDFGGLDLQQSYQKPAATSISGDPFATSQFPDSKPAVYSPGRIKLYTTSQHKMTWHDMTTQI